MTDIIDPGILTAQGPIFWAACAAVAMGLTMIVAAVVVQARRLRPGSAGRPDPVQGTREEGSALRQENADAIFPEGETSLRAAVYGNPVAVSPASDRLHSLLERLGTVADRLDQAEAREPLADPDPAFSAAQPPVPGETDLKEEAQGVEYVFKAAGG